MRTVMTIAQRELKTYFTSWMAYSLLAGYVAISGFFFFLALGMSGGPMGGGEVPISMVYSNMAVTLLFMVPILAMRLLAEEKSTGTIELLMTAPVTDWQVVMGKYLACLGVLFAALVLTIDFPLILLHYGSPDKGSLLAAYIGVFLIAGSMAGVGVLASSVTDSQVVAGLLGFGGLLFFWIIGWASQHAGAFWGEVLKYLAITAHLEDFLDGVIDTKHLIYHISFVFICLFYAVKVLESRKWK